MRLKPLIVVSFLSGLLLASCSESAQYTNSENNTENSTENKSKTNTETSAKQSATAVKRDSNNENIGQNILGDRSVLPPKLAPK